jgi:predicted nucleic acid-binding protein
MSLETAVVHQDEMADFMRGREYDVSSLEFFLLAHQSECSAYDCEFVALARSCQCRLVTMDGKLRSAFPDMAVSLQQAL